MTSTPEPQLFATPPDWSNSERAVGDAIVRNAVRLLEDAALLQTYERFGTAFTLATLAFEEIGKLAIKCWGDEDNLREVDRKWSYHLRKQTAAASLLMADLVNSTVAERRKRLGLSDYRGPIEDDNEEEAVKEVAKAMYESRVSRLLELIAMKAVERTKQIALYVDEFSLKNNFMPSHFSESDCSTSIDDARTCVRFVRSQVNLRVSKAIYLSNPLQRLGRADSRPQAGC